MKCKPKAKRKTGRASTSLNPKLEQLEERSECTIYRVHRHLRNVNPDAYEPEVIAIGPYHRGKDHLKMMEKHKLRNMQSLVKRLATIEKVDSGVDLSKARKCYGDQDFSLNDNEFNYMMGLDGCFIIELVRKFADGCLGENGDDPIFKMDWMITSLQRDLMLFENQLPYFVLCHIFNRTKSDTEQRTLSQLLTNFFRGLYPGRRHSGEVLQDGDHEIKHLLDLIHRDWVPQQLSPPRMPVQEKQEQTEVTMMGSMSVQERKENEEDMMDSMPLMPIQERKENEEVVMGSNSMPSVQERKETVVDMPLQGNKKHASREGSEDTMRFINCATELREANVEFKMEEENTSLFNIDFKDGVMVMPPLRIEDGTESFLRNLIVYEQYFEHQLSGATVTDYMKLLDSLINSAKDVEILSRKNIITNWQGDDEVVANMVNKLGDLVACGATNFRYAKVFKQVDEHCKRPWNRWMAKLRRDYLNSPWAIISIIVAVVLLLLTVMQTILSVLQVVREK